MKMTVLKALTLSLPLMLISYADAAEPGELIFEDHFERNESQEEQEEIGNGWKSNSRTRANGNKQVDLKNGAMYIKFHPSADHAVSVVHPFEFRNGVVKLRFMLENKGDSLGLNFADLSYKKVHAGHLFVARVFPNRVELQDLKTGNMDLKTRELRLAKKLPDELAEALKKKKVSFPNKIKVGEWHDLQVTVEDDTIRLVINGKEIGEFTSEGIAHPTKRLLRLAVPREAVVDDIMIYRTAS